MAFNKLVILQYLIKTGFYVLIIFLSSACSEKASQLVQLQVENDSLRSKIVELETQIQIDEEIRNTTKVTIANTDVKELTSKFNNQTYQIKISYPKSYFTNKERKYPVLYVIDAETNFGGVSYIVQRLIKDKLIPEILVVGIAYNTDYKNFYRLRSRDLTPVEDPDLRMGKNKVDPTGGAPQFSDFMEFELFPFIEKEFRIKKQDRAIYGHSYGGLFGSYLLLEKPQLFNKYVLLGPSLWFQDKLLVQEVQTKNLNFSQETRFYMGSGEEEFRIDDFQEEFVGFLKAKKTPKLVVKSEVIKNETHRTIFGVGFTNGLRFIYSR